MTLADQRSAVAAAFLERTGRAPEGVWAAPGRVNLIGEHTDYNDGFVLPFAIDRQVVVATARRDDGELRMWSLQQDQPVSTPLDQLAPGSLDGWAAYVAGVAWVLAADRVPISGADLVVSGDVPVGSGLSSSAAVECATGLALDEMYGVGMAPEERALLAQRAENEFVGVPSGAMDQMASTLGRAGNALFLDTRSLEHDQVPLELAAAGLVLLVIDTQASHSLVDSEYADRRRACELAADGLGVAALRDLDTAELDDAMAKLDEVAGRRVRHVVTENARVLEVVERLRVRRFAEVGPLLTASHASLRDDYQVSSVELDTAVDAALAGGALGARMTGAGFGGSAIALVPAPAVELLAATVRAAFADHHLRAPVLFPAVPSDGARRIG